MDDDTKDRFPLHDACREGKVSLAESLLAFHPTHPALPDPDGRLPIHLSLTSPTPHPLLLLLSTQPTFSVDARDALGWTPLMYSVSISPSIGVPCTELLLSRGADPNAKNDAGQTALHFTASKGNLEAARLLLAKGGTGRVKDKRAQQTPLHRAAASGAGGAAMVRLLLEEAVEGSGLGKVATGVTGKKVPYPIDATDVNGYTALHHACVEGHGDIAVVLLKAGAKWDKLDGESKLAIQLCPDQKVANYIRREALQEGIEL